MSSGPTNSLSEPQGPSPVATRVSQTKPQTSFEQFSLKLLNPTPRTPSSASGFSHPGCSLRSLGGLSGVRTTRPCTNHAMRNHTTGGNAQDTPAELARLVEQWGCVHPALFRDAVTLRPTSPGQFDPP